MVSKPVDYKLFRINFINKLTETVKKNQDDGMASIVPSSRIKLLLPLNAAMDC